jgi:hypothetical protein
LSTELRLKKTISPPQKMTCECLIDCSQISGQQVSLTFRAHSAPKDDVGYIITTVKDAELAYSFRRVANTTIFPEGSPVVRLLRDSDDEEQDFAFTNGRLDIADIEAWAGSSDVYIHTFYDQGGQGRNAVQTTKANMAKFANAGTVITLNGNVACTFDGTNDFYVLNAATTSNNAFCQTAVFERTAGTDNYMIANQGDTHAPMYWKATNSLAVEMSASAAPILASLLAGQKVVSTGRNNVLSAYIRVNNVQLDTATTAADIADSLDSFGKAVGSQNSGKFQEVIYWKKDKALEIDAIEDNINDYYNIF